MKIKNRQTILIIGFFLVVYIGLFYGIINPKISALQNKYSELKNKYIELANFALRNENIAQLKKEEQRIKNAEILAQNLVPKDKQTSDFLIQIQAAASQTGNNLESININESSSKSKTNTEEEQTTKESTIKTNKNEKETKYKTLGFSMNIEGNFKQLLDFLSLTESLSRFTNILNMTISSGEKGIKTNISGEIYYK